MEGFEGADHIFPVHADVQSEVVARPGRYADVGDVVSGGDGGHDRLGTVAAGHADDVGARRHGGGGQ